MVLKFENSIINLVRYFERNRWAFLTAGIHTLLTFYSDKFFFIASAREHWETVIFLKILLFFLLFKGWSLWFEIGGV